MLLLPWTILAFIKEMGGMFQITGHETVLVKSGRPVVSLCSLKPITPPPL